jgi:hypothetical protein
LPFGVLTATTWLNLMTIGACASAPVANVSAAAAANAVTSFMHPPEKAILLVPVAGWPLLCSRLR